MSRYRLPEPSPEERYRPDDGCPLFSPRLEAHLVAVSRGETPERGTFCGNCFTPIGRDTSTCPHCGESTATRRPVDIVPAPIADALRAQRTTEGRWVNGFAYIGVLIAMVLPLVAVLGIPTLKDSLILGTLVYAPLLFVGMRVFPAILGGYWGDRKGFEAARTRTRAAWEQWVAQRDSPAGGTRSA